MTALVGLTLLFQPAMVPSSVANSSVLGAEAVPAVMTKPVVALVATPVGADIPEPPGAGMVTAGCTALPVTSKLSAVPLPFSAIHSPLLVPSVMPQAFTRLGSVRAARPGMSETRLVWVKVTAGTRRLSSSSSRRRCMQGRCAECPRRERRRLRKMVRIAMSPVVSMDLFTVVVLCGGSRRRFFSRREMGADKQRGLWKGFRFAVRGSPCALRLSPRRTLCTGVALPALSISRENAKCDRIFQKWLLRRQCGPGRQQGLPHRCSDGLCWADVLSTGSELA